MDGERPISDDPRVFPMLDDSASLIGASAAWDWGFTGAGWYVAVLDTGIRKTHEMFAGKTILEATAGRWARTAPAAAPTAKPS